jgi:serine/threonine protein kinase
VYAVVVSRAALLLVLNATVKSFISGLLIRDPEHRPTALQALQHPWVTQDASALATELALSGSLEQYLLELREPRM